MNHKNEDAYKIYQEVERNAFTKNKKYQQPNFACLDGVTNIIKIYDTELYEKIKREQSTKINEIQNQRKQKFQEMRILLNTKISDLNFGNRITKILKDNGINSLNDITKLDEHELLKFDGFGRKCLQTVTQYLDERGLLYGCDYINNPTEIENSIDSI